MEQISQKQQPQQQQDNDESKQQNEQDQEQEEQEQELDQEKEQEQEQEIIQHLTQQQQLQSIQHCKVAVIGNVDSGKSTLVGVLTKGELDDGRGAARLKVFNYPHEAQNGRTSSIAHEIIGYDKAGQQILPERFNQNKNKYWAEIVEQSYKVSQIIDLCGHEKYLKTTMFGLTGLIPDYSMIIMAANNGFPKMTKEHLGITVALKIPFFIVITKSDICPPNIFKETAEELKKTLKIQFVQRIPIDIVENHNEQELKIYAEQMVACRICPIFNVSSVTGKGVKELLKFLFLLKNRDDNNCMLKSPSDPLEFAINEHFLVHGKGVVVSGIIRAGIAKLNQVVIMGPDKQQQFQQIVIKGIHVNRTSVEEAHIGEFTCLLIKPFKASDKLNRDEFRKGMVILDPQVKHETYQEFEADVVILHHSSTIQPNYQSVMHCGVIRQAAQVKFIYNKSEIKTGEKGLMRLRFQYNPEYIQVGLPVLFREGRTKILGIITRTFSQQELDQEQKEQQQKQIQLQQQQQIQNLHNKQTEETKTATIDKTKGIEVQIPQNQQNNTIQNPEEKKSADLIDENKLENIQQDMKLLDVQNKQHHQHRRRLQQGHPISKEKQTKKYSNEIVQEPVKDIDNSQKKNPSKQQ